MDEYAALAQRVVLTMDDVRGCLVLSRDGLVLGAFPEEEESALKPAWLRFVHVGEARKSFVEFGDQVWAYIYRGAYAAFVVAGTAARPGVLLDQLEHALLMAEETRAKRDTLKVPDAASAPSGRPRTSLHPDRPAPVEAAGAPPQERRVWSRGKIAGGTSAPAGARVSAGGGNPPVAQEPEPAQPGPAQPAAPTLAEVAAQTLSEVAAQTVGEALPESPAELEPAAEPAAGPTTDADAPEPAQEPTSTLRREPQRLVTPGAAEGDAQEGEDEAIDRVMLAKEFSGLLQMDAEADEGSS